ncbi:MAG TPA: formylglycine-generating enzyme family protein [Bryobacteraceae bacterium]|nr:formylglycine-generating enzyme family protein [Bryobacteraceae bacterium]
MRRAVAAAILLSVVATAGQRGGFVRIPPGRNGALAVESGLWMGRTEVTVGEFEKFVKTTGHQTTAEKAAVSRTWRQPGFQVSGKQPVVYVSLSDAEAYCTWIGGRLPTDTEWEYAARAGTTTRHYWGDAIDGRYLWFRENSDGRPRDVGKKRPNKWGLYDVEGNVWEWTRVEGQGEPKARRRGASWVSCEIIDGGPAHAPSLLISLTTGIGISARSEHRHDDIGFRCVKTGH